MNPNESTRSGSPTSQPGPHQDNLPAGGDTPEQRQQRQQQQQNPGLGQSYKQQQQQQNQRPGQKENAGGAGISASSENGLPSQQGRSQKQAGEQKENEERGRE